MTVYIDQFLLTNFCMNLLIIKVTKVITHSKVTDVKVLISAIFSAFLTLSVFIPHTPISVLINFAGTAIILYTTFKPTNLICALRTTAVFCIVTFAAAGCAYMISNIFMTYNLLTLLLPTVIFTYTIVGIIGEIYEKYYKMDRLKHKIQIYIKEKSVETECYFDTGNNLKDPVSKLPVIVTGIKTLNDILPESLVYQILHNESIVDIYYAYADKIKLKLIPFHTISGDGMMLGISADKILLDDKEIDAVIGISTNKVLLDNKNNILLNPSLII